MGEFTEVVMAFAFRSDTPPEVLAAFSALAQRHPEDVWWGPPPDLPEPVSEPQEWWSPDWREAGEVDEFEAEPWRHDWATWLKSSMSVAIVPSAKLAWGETRRWNLSCRCSFKSWPGAVLTFLEWLGPFIDSVQPERPLFLGYMLYDAEPRPHLLWLRDGRLVAEDLN